MFSYYNNINVAATLISTQEYFYLINIKEEIRIIYGQFQRKTIRKTYSVSIISCKDLCNCVLQTNEIQLIDRHQNCTSKGNFHIQYTINFVTE